LITPDVCFATKAKPIQAGRNKLAPALDVLAADHRLVIEGPRFRLIYAASNDQIYLDLGKYRSIRWYNRYTIMNNMVFASILADVPSHGWPRNQWHCL